VRSHALGRFWKYYYALPEFVRQQADEQFQLFVANPNHSSLRLKQVGPYWAVRVGRGYRALARRRDKDFFWFWIGSHDEYDRLIDR